MELHKGYLCPICNKEFKSDSCSHSVADVEQRNQSDHIRDIVRDELRKVKLIP